MENARSDIADSYKLIRHRQEGNQKKMSEAELLKEADALVERAKANLPEFLKDLHGLDSDAIAGVEKDDLKSKD